MRSTILYFLLFIFLLPSCGIGNAEEVADEFHQKLDAHDYEYIIEHLLDQKLLETEGEEAMLAFFELVESWGPIKNRKKSSGFNQKMKNGITTVKLDYTFENDIGKMYEGIVLVKREDGYKVFTVIMNTKKSVVDSELSEF